MRFDFYKTIYKELHRKGFLVTLEGVKEQLMGHPYYPSVQSVSDYLSDMNIPNTVVRIDFEQLTNAITEGNAIVLVHGKEGDNLLWIKEIDNNRIIFSDNSSYDIGTFLSLWQGVSIIFQPAEVSKENNFESNIRSVRIKSVWQIIGLLGIVFIILYYCLKINFGFFECLSLFIKIGGILFCFLLLSVELGFKFNVTKKLCSLSSGNGCEKVAHSRIATFKHLISLADIGLIYFVSITLYFFIEGSNLLAYIALLCVFVILFSVSYQTLKLKVFCPLCLCVMLMLSLDILVYYLDDSYSKERLSEISLSDMSLFCGLFLFVAGCWAILKKLFKDKNWLESYKYQYLRLLQRPDRIKNIVNCMSEETFDENPYEILLGDKKTQFLITEVMNPYCFPCGFSMSKIVKLLNRFEVGLQFKIFFVPKKTDREKSELIIRYLLSYAKENDSQKTIDALLFWFSSMDFVKWKNRYPIQLLISENDLVEYFKMIKMLMINHTPTIFINGKRLDDEMSLDNLVYFIEDECPVV